MADTTSHVHGVAHESPSRREAVNLSVDAAVLAQARELGIPLSATFEAALRARVIEAQRARWRIENAEGIEAYNARVEAEGVFSDGLRRF